MSVSRPKHVHFMGIGGSGMSAVALIANNQGYKVSGCDLAEATPYLDKVKKSKIPTLAGHNSKHLEDVDILTATPAAFFQSDKNPEFVTGKKLKTLITWQEFLGKYLHKGKKVICIAGTHGKSTTTALAALLFEKEGLDPSVVIGATVKKWGANYRNGKSMVFITEADEFFDNFLNYNPEVIVLNNIELDHPDFFNNETHVLKSFSKFVKNLKGKKVLIINQDSPGIKKLFRLLDKKFLSSLSVLGYTLTDNPKIGTAVSIRGKILEEGRNSTTFSAVSDDLKLNDNFKLKILGEHNVANSLGVIVLASIYKIDTAVIRESFATYSGIGRRLELIGTKGGVKVYDDYAHHPTEIGATINALRQEYPEKRIWVIVEPHSFSRTKALLKDYKKVFNFADEVVIGPIFPARDKKTFGVSSQSIVDVADHKNIKSIDNIDEISAFTRRKIKPDEIIVVMGAGESYKWSRQILKVL